MLTSSLSQTQSDAHRCCRPRHTFTLPEDKAIITIHNHQTPDKTEAYLKRQDLKSTTLNQLLFILPTPSKINGNDYMNPNGLEIRNMKGLMPIFVAIHKIWARSKTNPKTELWVFTESTLLRIHTPANPKPKNSTCIYQMLRSVYTLSSSIK